MPIRTRVAALAALTATALAVGATATAQAGAAPNEPARKTASAQKTAAAPRFLAASELPPHPTGWTAGPVTDGFPEQLAYCLGEGVPAYDYRHRLFHTDLDTSAVQVTVVTGSAAKGKALAALLDEEIRGCAARLERLYPEIEAEGRFFGTLPVEEGASVHGLHTETSYGATDVNLLSVGRDGRTVTVVGWGQMGDFDDAPLAAFKKTAKKAVIKLY
ncbi:hypothetical protein [Streptomyces pseudogriseolus]|uniref:Lipoprotein n=1 Tax=Streptomyces pseudogriseolus TaxID=36817 RepID=A0ABQ2SGV6_STREZ|nr:hypothetical protein [Streptomyces rubiginosus]GGP97958.1 hypothetical protein GCM10010233_12910 [Streptomyces gancidicus]GGS27868.1 hypothetical protein GCM10010285_02420 [Streptomyces rubiginosus]